MTVKCLSFCQSSSNVHKTNPMHDEFMYCADMRPCTLARLYTRVISSTVMFSITNKIWNTMYCGIPTMHTPYTSTSCRTAIARGQRIQDRPRSQEHDSSLPRGLAKKNSICAISIGIFSARGAHTRHRLYVKT